MPNWCYNRINVFGDGEEKTTEQIKKIEKIFESKTPFNEIFPNARLEEYTKQQRGVAKVGANEESRWFDCVGNL